MKVTAELLDKAEERVEEEMPWLHYGLTAFGKVLTKHVIDELLPEDPALVERMQRLSERHER